MFDVVITGADVVIFNENKSQIEQLDIGIKNGQIEAIGHSLSTSESQSIFKADGLTLLPGLIDTQVHFREPGLTHKETIESGSKGALKGGLTGFFEMPNTSPATTSVEALQQKIDIAQSTSWTNYAFYGGAAEESLPRLNQMENLPGCCGIKLFMGSSTGNLLVSEEELLEEVVKKIQFPMAVHCEDESRLVSRKNTILNIENPSVHLHPVWRDEETAFLATEKIVRLAKKHNKKIHVLHITTKKEMEFLAQHKDVVTVECTPQHLTLSAPECYEKLGTKAQMNPPVRTQEHQIALWEGVKNKTVDIIGSDHAPHTLEEKAKPYPQSPSGMTGVQTTVPLLLNHIHQQKISIFDLVRLMSFNPAKVFSIQGHGEIKPGASANLTLVDLKKKMTITDHWIESRSGWTPFDGTDVVGWPEAVFLNGQLAMKNGTLLDKVPIKHYTFDR